MATTPISVQDALWLTMDRPNNLMIVDAVLWFHQPLDFAAVRAVLQKRLVDRYPVYSSIALHSGSGWVWRTDPAFRIDDHVRRVNLPAPVTVTDVQKFVSAERSKPLPRNRALWVFYLVDGVHFDDGHVGAALVSRMHHSIADGVRLMQVLLGLCDDAGDPEVAARTRSSGGGPVRPADSPSPTTAERVSGAVAVAGEVARDVLSGAATLASTVGHGAVDGLTAAARHAAERAAEGVRSPSDAVAGAVSDVKAAVVALPGVVAALPGRASTAAEDLVERSQDLAHETLEVLSHRVEIVDFLAARSVLPDVATNTVSGVGALLAAPHSVHTVWSGPAGVPKTVTWVDSFPLPWVKDVGVATGTTVNDVLLSVVAGTLQRYLAEHGDQVDEVMWLVPVSLVPFEPGMPEGLGNHFALIPLRMPLSITDPHERIAEMHRRMELMKHSYQPAVTFGLQRLVSSSPEQVSTALTTYLANRAVGVLSNVPGPRSRLTMAGTPLAGLLGWAPCSGDQPLTVCIMSYADNVHVGFGADATLVPDAERLAPLFVEEGVAMYTAVVGHPPIVDHGENHPSEPS
jgi:diacylglycerol O-acyltransferase